MHGDESSISQSINYYLYFKGYWIFLSLLKFGVHHRPWMDVNLVPTLYISFLYIRHNLIQEYKCLFPVMGQINLVFLWVRIFFPSLFSIHNIRYSLTSLVFRGWHVSATHFSSTDFTHGQRCLWSFFSSRLYYYDARMSNLLLVMSFQISNRFL